MFLLNYRDDFFLQGGNPKLFTCIRRLDLKLIDFFVFRGTVMDEKYKNVFKN